MEIVQEFGKSILVVDDNSVNENDYMIHMLINNSIRGLLQCNQGIYNNRNVLKYDITNMVSIRKKYGNMQMTGDDIAGFLRSVSDIMDNSRKYLLEDNNHIIDPDYMFSNLVTNEVALVYIPFSNDDNTKEGRYRLMADFLLEVINHKDEMAVDIAYNFYKLSKEPLFSINTFCQLYCKEVKTPEICCDRAVGMESVESNSSLPDLDEMPEVSNEVVSSIHNEKKKGKWRMPIGLTVTAVIFWLISRVLLRNNPYSIYMIYFSVVTLASAVIFTLLSLIRNLVGDKTEDMKSVKVNVEEYWYDDSETKFFDDDMTVFFDESNENKKAVRLNWIIAGEKRSALIEEFPCIIGKKFDEVDICIGDESVSRIHASLSMKNNKLYIKDLGSTNGTFVDGNRLLKNEEAIIDGKAQIRFGKVDVNVV